MSKKLLKRRNEPAEAALPPPFALDLISAPSTDMVPVGSMDYAAQKDLLDGADLAARLRLAQAHDTRPEILYFLASDEAPEV